tara:strand:+ start:1094 stop:1456 length:363 start_codon:yes stop_codon:yes gene_type:complete
MYNNLNHIFGYKFGNNYSYVDYYYSNNHVLKLENDLLKKKLKKEKNRYDYLNNEIIIIEQYLSNLEYKINVINNEYDDLKIKYEILKNYKVNNNIDEKVDDNYYDNYYDNDIIIEDYEKI